MIAKQVPVGSLRTGDWFFFDDADLGWITCEVIEQQKSTTTVRLHSDEPIEYTASGLEIVLANIQDISNATIVDIDET